jgi:hypothetical protein
MKAVAPDTFLIERIGQSEGLLDLRRSAVKGSIEACHLRQFGIEAHRHLDGREVVRLVQWCQRHQRLQLGDQFGSDAGRSRVMEAAMDDAMAERREPPVA